MAKQSAVLRASLQQNFSKAMELFQEGRECGHQKVKLQTYPSKPTTEVKKEPTEANVNMEEEPVDDFMNVEGPWPDTP